MRSLFGEFLGTFIIVFIGCGAVGVAITTTYLQSLLVIATFWGIGVALAIFLARPFGTAHLNPAVSIAMAISGNFSFKKVPSYLLAQLAGGILGGFLLFLFFDNPLAELESSKNIVRGSYESLTSAKMFGEFYPNSVAHLSLSGAMLWEGVGTLLLLTSIYIVDFFPKMKSYLPPLLIGLTVSLIILLVAPYTQAGLNPARDFGPRIVAYFSGWGDGAFPKDSFGFFLVYILAPILGGGLVALLKKFIFKKKF